MKGPEQCLSTLWLIRDDEGCLSRMKEIIQEGSQEEKGVEGNLSQCQEVGEWKNVTQKRKEKKRSHADKTHHPSWKAYFKGFSVGPSLPFPPPL